MFDAKKTTEEIINWISSFYKKTAPEAKAVVGISGGKDSSVCAALCARALGKTRVVGVLMPQWEQSDIKVSYDLCKSLDVPFSVINIGEATQSIYNELEKNRYELNDLASFNTPARIRMASLYAVAASVGGLVVNTSNFSEDYVGYATKYGDSAGDFAPIADLTVTEVKAVGAELGLASKFIDKVPIDGLCGKTDEENLGFSYETLDRYIREGLCEDERTRSEIDRLHVISRHKFVPMPTYRLKK